MDIVVVAAAAAEAVGAAFVVREYGKGEAALGNDFCGADAAAGCVEAFAVEEPRSCSHCFDNAGSLDALVVAEVVDFFASPAACLTRTEGGAILGPSSEVSGLATDFDLPDASLVAVGEDEELGFLSALAL